MRAALLHVVTCVANPLRWESRVRLYRQFEQHMLDSGVHLTTVECAYGERPFECAGTSGVNHVGVRSRTLVWNKEALINIGMNRLPEGWQYMAWLDADIFFRRCDWAKATVHALQQYDVVQPWSDCYDLGPKDEHLQTHRSFCRIHHEGKPIRPASGHGYEFAHPGYGWAATRSALDAVGGLVEAALGAGDHHMALALIGRVHESVPRGIHPNYLAAITQWQERAERAIAGNIGYVPGTIEHHWHGSKDKRGYISRWGILTKHQFDPLCDLRRNTFGVPELAGNKPKLRLDLDRYFRSRDEDANTV